MLNHRWKEVAIMKRIVCTASIDSEAPRLAQGQRAY